MVDVTKLKSHPDKLLFKHIDGVVKNAKLLSNSKITELVAIFHDLGKVNPNFQKKLDGIYSYDYANHSYLSAFAFYCAFATSKENRNILENWLNCKINGNDLIALTVIIAKHHGNIPDFISKAKDYSDASILNFDENERLFDFIEKTKNIPIEEFTKQYFPEIECFYSNLLDKRFQKWYKEQLIFNSNINDNPLDFYLRTQFSFASLVQADKVDAAEFKDFIDVNNERVKKFCIDYTKTINEYINKLNQDSKLNKLRTSIRLDAIKNIISGLQNDKRVFNLTAPTGSGKTLMMLSLASEIIEKKGPKRIIYSLPFLSITEQVESEVLKIFNSKKEYVQRIDSKSQNKVFEELQNELDKNPSKKLLQKINLIEFQENTFSYPFIITTFVRFFETILSNKNAELLKLPNFSNSIFLLDEIQALPPRLYSFLVAFLTRFCELNNSYAIISTATQPNFSLPKDDKIKNFFHNYIEPYSLLSLDYFQNELFNRYKININKEGTDIDDLKEELFNLKESALIILNTIDDTKDLYNLLVEKGISKEEVLLLNTHITPRHRKIKIYLAKRKLRENKRIILISTQLIEAGVDIDFPVLYRDLTTISSIVQSAGRCNRNGKLKNKGVVNLIRFKKDGRERAKLIFRGENEHLLKFTTQSLQNENYLEKELLSVQKSFFDRILKELNFAKHSQQKPKQEFDLIKDIKEAAFDKIGQFHLIDKGVFGEEYQYYVPKNENDTSFEILKSLKTELDNLYSSGVKDWSIVRQIKNKIKSLRKKMSENIIQVRIKKNDNKPIITNSTKNEDLFELALTSYSFEKGVDLQGEDIWL